MAERTRGRAWTTYGAWANSAGSFTGGPTAGGLAGCMWWATVLADSQDVAATSERYEKHSAWYAGPDASGRVIDFLVEKGRIDTATRPHPNGSHLAVTVPL